MTVFEMAMKYYPNLWDKSRLDQLLTAGKFTKEEYDKIVNKTSCTENDHVYQSAIDNNVWPPSGYPAGWADLGTVEDVQGAI